MDCQGWRVWKLGTVVKGGSGEVVGSVASPVELGWRILRNLKSFSRFEICWLMASIFGGGRVKV